MSIFSPSPAGGLKPQVGTGIPACPPGRSAACRPMSSTSPEMGPILNETFELAAAVNPSEPARTASRKRETPIGPSGILSGSARSSPAAPEKRKGPWPSHSSARSQTAANPSGGSILPKKPSPGAAAPFNASPSIAILNEPEGLGRLVERAKPPCRDIVPTSK